ncbi:hypothetical protein PG988_002053 [Apiospora saccharicola]
MAGAKSLPPEIISMILAQIEGSQRPTCAAVCKSWQAVVEKATFHTMTLRPDDLMHFLEIIYPHRHRHPLVKKLVFCVPLGSSLHFPEPKEEEYDQVSEEYRERDDNHVETFTEAMVQLLTLWTLFNDVKEAAFSLELMAVGTDNDEDRYKLQQQGLTVYHMLQLGARAPTDEIVEDGLFGPLGPRSVNFKPRKTIDQDGDCVTGSAFVPSSPASFNSMEWGGIIIACGPTCQLYPPGLNAVQAVTELRISARCFPYIGDTSRALIMRSLPNLTHVAFEKWHEEWPDEFLSHQYPVDWFGATLPNWPQSLKSIYLYEVPDIAESDDENDAEDSTDSDDDDGYLPDEAYEYGGRMAMLSQPSWDGRTETSIF